MSAITINGGGIRSIGDCTESLPLRNQVQVAPQRQDAKQIPAYSKGGNVFLLEDIRANQLNDNYADISYFQDDGTVATDQVLQEDKDSVIVGVDKVHKLTPVGY